MFGKAGRGLDRALGAAGRIARSRATGEARKRLAAKDAEIAALRAELARLRGDAGGDAAGAAADMPATPIFFVFGYQRSGTTWLMNMLDAHPEVLCMGEGRIFGAGWRQKGLVRSGADRPPSSLLYALREAEYLRYWIERSVWSRREPASEHLDNLSRMAVDYFLGAELLKSGKRLVGDKSPLLTPETMREAGEVYPEAKAIHILRDGRDAAVSSAHHAWNFGNAAKNPDVAARRDRYRKDPEAMRAAGESIFAGGQLEKLAADWAARVGRAAEDGPKLFGGRYAEVRYEDLVARPVEEMARLLRFLGAADSGEGAAARCVESASFEKLSAGRKRGEEDPTSFYRKGVAGDWEETFTGRDRRVFEEEAGEVLAKLGYGDGAQDGNVGR